MEFKNLGKYLLVLLAIGTLLLSGCSSSIDGAADTKAEDNSANTAEESTKDSTEEDIVEDGLTTVESDDDVEIGELI